MLNRRFSSNQISMSPEGSLNRLPVMRSLLHSDDPLRNQTKLTAFDLVSRQAFLTLLSSAQHPSHNNLRTFLTHFNEGNAADHRILTFFAKRFAAVIHTARNFQDWRDGSAFQKALLQHWRETKTLVISGGLSSHQFGIHLATELEENLAGLTVLTSPWGGLTALYGLAQTYGSQNDILVLDFGATGIKRGIAHKYGNHIHMLKDIKAAPYKHDGLIRAAQFQEILKQTHDELNVTMPVAISLACYLKEGHPYDYYSGIYHRLRDDCEHLQTALHQQWLPQAGFSGLALLAHDSTAAALAFQFRTPAMMVTLGTQLGSAPCPRVPSD